MSTQEWKVSDDDSYDRAITLIQYYVQLQWLIFGVFMLAETVLLGTVVSIFDDGPRVFVVGGSAFGLLLVLPWWTSFRYNHSLYRLRVEEARSMEKDNNGFFNSGKKLIDKSGAANTHGVSMPGLARAIPPRGSVQFLMVLFAIAFVGVGAWALIAPGIAAAS